MLLNDLYMLLLDYPKHKSCLFKRSCLLKTLNSLKFIELSSENLSQSSYHIYEQILNMRVQLYLKNSNYFVLFCFAVRENHW